MNSITPPPEVQKSIDDRSRLGLFEDLNKLLQMKAAMAMEKAAEGDGTANAGMGMGVGLMMPAMFSQFFASAGQKQHQPQFDNITCPECKKTIISESKFCPHCGHQQLIFSQCLKCKKNLTPNAKFCSRCGHRVEEKPGPGLCKHCGTENLADAVYCNHCGEKL
jgi:membrane protease subunit (stomatin/prohibitin family)